MSAAKIDQPMIGIFGGTFDPVHHGHMRIALDVQQSLALDSIRFIPCKLPVHRNKPVLGAEQRLHLLQLAVEDHTAFIADDRELLREGPSFMIDTLDSLRKDYPQQALVLMVGTDAFAKFDQWHRWQEIFERAHLVLMQRPGFNLDSSENLDSCSEQLATQIRQRLVGELNLHLSSKDLHDLLAKKSTGSIICVPVTQLKISASDIRDKVKIGEDIRYLLPEPVRLEIGEQHYYQSG